MGSSTLVTAASKPLVVFLTQYDATTYLDYCTVLVLISCGDMGNYFVSLNSPVIRSV